QFEEKQRHGGIVSDRGSFYPCFDPARGEAQSVKKCLLGLLEIDVLRGNRIAIDPCAHHLHLSRCNWQLSDDKWSKSFVQSCQRLGWGGIRRRDGGRTCCAGRVWIGWCCNGR